ncbi:carboxypeptidase-like regulatory domain-containing protein [Planctomicrobium piriforme]|uniref:Carboxypeptidase regulatory-like domain-containing protein n=1 Tax=Planctomicrobium piriforme TaxID=1576369 RepID=A0A1I3GK79_9PLAN|nr:carboxypeptidase-like regulatory domain-containing protein [Planctomicrobium piriforme]SFI23887.1 hypothetical protein SAMN05421753_10731 [Planctomicrobium piriforme]
MLTQTRGRLVVVAMLVAVTFVGCGGKPKGPELGEVTGIVTMDGAPLPNKTIVFASEKARPAMGTTDAEGRYTLTYAGNEKGTPVGRSTVTISTPLDHPPGPTYKDPVPAKYNTASELGAEVKPGKQEFNFDLKSK